MSFVRAHSDFAGARKSYMDDNWHPNFMAKFDREQDIYQEDSLYGTSAKHRSYIYHHQSCSDFSKTILRQIISSIAMH